MSHLYPMKARARGLRRTCCAVLAGSLAIAIVLLGSVPAAHANLTINATFDPSLDASSVAAINTAIADYQSTFTNNVAVSIYFNSMTGGLGESNTGFYDIGYQAFRAGLQSNFTASGNPNQGIALANLPNTTNNPVTGTPDLNVSSADGRILLQNTPGFLDQNGNAGGTYDGVIRLNTSITFPPQPQSGSTYSLIAVAQHEIDEVLGLPSDVGGTGFFAHPAAMDLYRFQHNSTTRSFTTAGDNAWFSINGGTTSLVQFNQDGVGDYGDWHTSATVRVQDAYGTPDQTPTILNDGGAEVTALNVIGYDIQTVPEPSTMWIMGMGAVFFSGYGFWCRKRSARKTAA